MISRGWRGRLASPSFPHLPRFISFSIFTAILVLFTVMACRAGNLRTPGLKPELSTMAGGKGNRRQENVFGICLKINEEFAAIMAARERDSDGEIRARIKSHGRRRLE